MAGKSSVEHFQPKTSCGLSVRIFRRRLSGRLKQGGNLLRSKGIKFGDPPKLPHLQITLALIAMRPAVGANRVNSKTTHCISKCPIYLNREQFAVLLSSYIRFRRIIETRMLKLRGSILTRLPTECRKLKIEKKNGRPDAQ